MIVQAIGWVLCIVLAFPLTYPTLLQMLGSKNYATPEAVRLLDF